MYIEETGADDPVGNDPFHDDPVGNGDIGNGDIDGRPGSADLGGADAGIAGRGGSLLLDTPQGVRDVGPATEDTNANGRPDTAVVDEGRGMLLVTDLDGDAAADQTVRIEDTGGVTVSRHTGPGQWTVVEQRGAGQDVPGAPGEPVPVEGSAPRSTDDSAWALGDPALPDPGQPDLGRSGPEQSAPAQPNPVQPNPETSAPEQPIPARPQSEVAGADADAVWA